MYAEDLQATAERAELNAIKYDEAEHKTNPFVTGNRTEQAEFIKTAVRSGMSEVKAAQIALAKSENAKVRELAAMLAAEMRFALYFAANFHTQGSQAVYYVPNDGRHSGILLFTTISVASLTVYLVYFARQWLYAPDES